MQISGPKESDHKADRVSFFFGKCIFPIYKASQYDKKSSRKYKGMMELLIEKRIKSQNE